MQNAHQSQIANISDLAYRKFGIHISDNKYPNLEIKLANLIRKENLSGMDELYARLLSDDRSLIAAFTHTITTSHTFFFREAEHFSQLAQFIKNKSKSEYTIWCAASSSGEEAYSIIMTLLDIGITNFKVIASDLNKSILRRFNQGIYHANRLEGVSSFRKNKYFTEVDNSTYQINHDLRRYVFLKNLNLMDTFFFPEKFDFIFCRNVLIYFDETSRMRALTRLTDNLKPGGKLFIGHAETLLSQPKNLIRIANSIYERT